MSGVENFTSIGNSSNMFGGTFDGDYVGLFGVNGGTIKNVTLDNVDISGNDNVGGLVGSNGGTVKNNTRLYKLTLPEGVVASGSNVKTVDGVHYAPSGLTVKFAAKAGYVYSTENSFTITEDTTVTATDVWGVGDGSTANPFLINTAEDLQHLATYVNDGNTCEGLNFKLAGDLDLSGVNFTPVGNRSNQFAGTFDGNNKTVSNLKISGSKSYVGLFGCNGGTIRNCTSVATVSGDYVVGGLVGSNSGTVKNNTRLYKLTMPEGVTTDNTNFTVDNKSYVAEDVAIAADGAEDNPYITISIDDKPTIYGGAGHNIITGGNALVELDDNHRLQQYNRRRKSHD